jgi:hypothetical protein
MKPIYLGWTSFRLATDTSVRKPVRNPWKPPLRGSADCFPTHTPRPRGRLVALCVVKDGLAIGRWHLSFDLLGKIEGITISNVSIYDPSNVILLIDLMNSTASPNGPPGGQRPSLDRDWFESRKSARKSSFLEFSPDWRYRDGRPLDQPQYVCFLPRSCRTQSYITITTDSKTTKWQSLSFLERPLLRKSIMLITTCTWQSAST